LINNFHIGNFQSCCDQLATIDREMKQIIQSHGYPPMWTRPASFATLIHIILEQQVSLASALAAFNKLKQKTGTITPEKLLKLSDEEMKACYFSRQKMVYARHLAEAIISKKIQLKKLSSFNDEDIRTTLKQVKGIGDWTADVFLMFALQRADIFPVGDLAMVNALKEVKQLPKQTAKEELLLMAESWRPYRSIAAMLLWHHYIKTRNIKI
jgi:DNA-3-methyladenine glycosylase II